jgi:hypothetical protein
MPQQLVDNKVLAGEGDGVPDYRPDHQHAAREADARQELLADGASELPRPPWRHPSEPPPAAELIRFALWRAGRDDLSEQALLAALALLPAARAETDQIEAALLLTARSSGLPWPRISRAMGLASAQAAQQRFERVTGRVEHGPTSRAGHRRSP